ncbi:hypothetical protein CYMTET_52351 [Cymbomonas tetramitiformis]|uniref:Uncharacterized protein n=1 Tax=Cymbomonas tetramitiformis TaxID=36881 RepID=A0AAE0BKC4_9CHLO|nr:hypothetical protein CYMTET_52351 [Cymbomonas tetramitiformis]
MDDDVDVDTFLPACWAQPFKYTCCPIVDTSSDEVTVFFSNLPDRDEEVSERWNKSTTETLNDVDKHGAVGEEDSERSDRNSTDRNSFYEAPDEIRISHQREITMCRSPEEYCESLKGKALLIAAKNGNVQKVVDLLQAGVPITSCDEAGATALHLAAENGRQEVAAVLMGAEAETNAVTKYGATPLYAAAFRGQSAIVQMLVQHQADLKLQTRSGATALHAAAQKGNTKVVQLLLSAGAGIAEVDQNMATPLHAAARRGFADVAKLLIYSGAATDARTASGMTPLHAAAERGHDEVVKVLLNHGSATDPVTKNGVTPLYTAAMNGHRMVVVTLLAAGANRDGMLPVADALDGLPIKVNDRFVQEKIPMSQGKEPQEALPETAATRVRKDEQTTMYAESGLWQLG